GAQLVDVDAGLQQQRAHGAALALQQRQQHVSRLHELVVAADRQRLRIRKRLLKTAREFVHPHGEHRSRSKEWELRAKWGPRRAPSRVQRAKPKINGGAMPAALLSASGFPPRQSRRPPTLS